MTLGIILYQATCPVCGIYTRFQDGQLYICCACNEPYVIIPDPITYPNGLQDEQP